jgi:hypothetical protein
MILQQLKDLKSLEETGVLDEEEFKNQKSKLLSSKNCQVCNMAVIYRQTC